jgi:hypothetical protein
VPEGLARQAVAHVLSSEQVRVVPQVPFGVVRHPCVRGRTVPIRFREVVHEVLGCRVACMQATCARCGLALVQGVVEVRQG